MAADVKPAKEMCKRCGGMPADSLMKNKIKRQPHQGPIYEASRSGEGDGNKTR